MDKCKKRATRAITDVATAISPVVCVWKRQRTTGIKYHYSQLLYFSVPRKIKRKKRKAFLFLGQEKRIHQVTIMNRCTDLQRYLNGYRYSS